MDNPAHAIGIAFIGAGVTTAHAVGLDFIGAGVSIAYAVGLDMITRVTQQKGYIAGTVDGIVTIDGNPVKREIICLETNGFMCVKRVYSQDNGHYLLDDLDPEREYLFFARDYKKEYEPVGYDHVEPVTKLSIKEQRELWQKWQSD